MSRTGQEQEDRSLPRRLEYVVARVVIAGFNLLPERVAYFAADRFMALLMLLIPWFRRRALANVEIAFGDTHDPDWRKRVSRESFNQLAWYFVDVLTMARRLRDPAQLARVDLSEIQSVFERDGVGTETGAILIAGHMGVPEVASLALALSGHPNTVIVRKLDNAFLWDYVNREREGIPRVMLTKHGALRGAYKVLAKKSLIALQPDQDARSHGHFVWYFGRRASTHGGAATLALLSRAPVYVVMGVRTARRRADFRVHCDGPLTFEPTGEHEQDVKALTQLMTTGLEQMVRRYPEHNMWAHRRWKTRPPWTKMGAKQVERRKRQAERQRARERAEASDL